MNSIDKMWYEISDKIDAAIDTLKLDQRLYCDFRDRYYYYKPADTVTGKAGEFWIGLPDEVPTGFILALNEKISGPFDYMKATLLKAARRLPVCSIE